MKLIIGLLPLICAAARKPPSNIKLIVDNTTYELPFGETILNATLEYFVPVSLIGNNSILNCGGNFLHFYASSNVTG